ncbi:hypothetical protein ACO229_20145 [Promicromonospora sp. MS192]|uniref:hypothetical protein n=1 Tax=Promicromonospora sp. MS192 TaxID=3412684 RepID=UPI003C2E8242
MRSTLVAGVTAAGMVLGAFVAPATAVEPPPTAECGITVWDETEAALLAASCDDDVEVHGATAGGGTRLFVEPDGQMRVEMTASDPSISRAATARTALSSAGAPGYGWTGTRWVGFCDPAEYGEGCDEAGVQRLVWQFAGIDLLQALEPEDVTSAEFIATSDVAWLDDVNCTPSRLDLYDVPRISADTGWSSTATWTPDRYAGSMSVYWPACEQTPAYTGYHDFDATELALRAVQENRSVVTVGVRAADETCMTCGWTSFKPAATLVIRFNRAPLAPTDLQVGVRGATQPCTDGRVLRSAPYLSALLRDPDPSGGSTDPDDTAPVTSTFRVARADASEIVVWEGAGYRVTDHQQAVEVPFDVLENGVRYVWSVFGTDSGGLVGPSTSCTFSMDFEAPSAPVVTPLVGAPAVYPESVARGGAGVTGSFLLTSASDDVVTYRYTMGSGSPAEVPATEHTVINVAPPWAGFNTLTVDALDRAGNRSRTDYQIYAGGVDVTPTPPAVTVSVPTSYTFGSTPRASVTLSADAANPYGTLTVTSGSAVLGSTVFDERTEQVGLNGSALGAGTRTITFTYRAFPGAPAWSTQRTVTVRPLTFSVPQPPSISGTVQVGRILTANRKTWTPAPTTVRYQWRVNGAAVAGATSATWKVPASAKGKKVTVAVTGSRFGYATRTAVSPATAAVKAGTFVVPALKITGTAKVGYTLKAVRGTWTPQPSVVRYQWKVGGVVVRGATGSSFKVPASARGKRVAVVVTGSRTGYTTRTVSALTGVVR